MNLISLINFIIEHKQYKNYLELGVHNGATFMGINCRNKVSVDNMSSRGGFIPTHQMTTDIFFEKVAPTLKEKFDIIFVDAFHESAQTYRDIASSLLYLEKDGLIITHDTLPHAKGEIVLTGQGTSYESFMRLRCENSDLAMCSLDFYHEPTVEEGIGVGIIKNGHQKTYKIDESDRILSQWDLYVKNKRELMNIIPASSFGRWLDEN